MRILPLPWCSLILPKIMRIEVQAKEYEKIMSEFSSFAQHRNCKWDQVSSASNTSFSIFKEDRISDLKYKLCWLERVCEALVRLPRLCARTTTAIRETSTQELWLYFFKDFRGQSPSKTWSGKAVNLVINLYECTLRFHSV